jgi:tRNA (cmo5U34)-methyltransferase
MTTPHWSESASERFIAQGDLFVPDRERQVDAICSLIRPEVGDRAVVELCCGDGTLAAAVLERHPECTVHGLDGSEVMLAAASARLAGAGGGRFRPQRFELADTSWRARFRDCAAVVSSLAVHHLLDDEKRRLFADVAAMLAPGGVFVLADVVAPATPVAQAWAARRWDEAVRDRSRARFGDDRGLDEFTRLRWNSYYPENADPEDEDIDHLAPTASLLPWIADGGLRPVDIVWADAGHVIFAGWKPPP